MTLNLRPRTSVDYKLLNSGEVIKFEKVNCKPVLDEDFYVERLIWRRKDKERSGYEYLVKWRDYRIEECTWEPEVHLPESVVSNYIPSTACTERLRQFSESFERAIKSRLRSRNPKSVIPVDYDLFRYVFGDETSHVCNIDDFSKLDLSDHWYYELKKDGNGRKIKFPVKLSVRLCRRKMYVKIEGKLTMRETVLERCTVMSCTEACNVSDL